MRLPDIEPVTSSTRETSTSRDDRVASEVAEISISSVPKRLMNLVGMVTVAVTVTVRSVGLTAMSSGCRTEPI
jgi:hypothetical protein